MKLKLIYRSDVHEIEFKRSKESVSISLGEFAANFEIINQNGNETVLNLGGKVIRGAVRKRGDKFFVQFRGKSFLFEDVTRTGHHQGFPSVGAVTENVTSPMPGTVIKVNVEPGQAVTSNQSLVIVEAMKMENDVRAPADLTVDKVMVKPGQQVGAGEILVTFIQSDSEKN